MRTENVVLDAGPRVPTLRVDPFAWLCRATAALARVVDQLNPRDMFMRTENVVWTQGLGFLHFEAINPCTHFCNSLVPSSWEHEAAFAL